MPARSSPNWPPFLWHHRVHTEKRGERLFYWRVGFEQRYERDRVQAAIESACQQHGVKGIIVYELLGAYDLLIRAWLPRDCSFEQFNETLVDELKTTDPMMCDPFAVDYMVRHWPFMKADRSTDGPEERWLSQLLDTEIEEVENDWPTVSRELLSRLMRNHLLAALEPDSLELPGIKFAIEVSCAPDIDPRSLAEFEDELVGVLDAADKIAQRSLYAGSGFAHFLILGRVGYENFHTIHSALITQMTRSVLTDAYDVRTLTHISGQRGYRIAREGLSGGGTGESSRRVRAFLRRPIFTRGEPAGILRPGDDLGGRFEIARHLGGGGFANVYAARDRFEKVTRAVKVFKSTDPEIALREIAALRRINHPNVVKALWGDRDGQHWYLVTEFIDGKKLSECERVSDVWALSVMIEALEALEAVHPDDGRISELSNKPELTDGELAELQTLKDRGLIHRDIKPDNIIVRDDGHVTLVDFNIASPARQPGATRSGSPEYMGPDAGFGGWEPSDDLFSCGVILYELLVGQHPFPNRHPVAGAGLIDPATVRRDLSPTLRELLLRACSPLRMERYQTALEMRRALEAERSIVENFERRVRRAYGQWRSEQPEGLAQLSALPAKAPTDSAAPIELARLLITHLEEGPGGVDDDGQSKEASPDGGRNGHRDNEDYRDDEEDDDADEGTDSWTETDLQGEDAPGA